MAKAFELVLACASLVACVTVAEAGAFLHGRSPQLVSREVLEQVLSAEIPSAANRGRLAVLMKQLQPTYASLPKNEQGQLDPPTVRYALHRHFVQQHGWYVKGLDPAGSGWNDTSSTSSAEIMADLAPAYIQELMHKRLHGQGLKLDDLATVAATLTDLIQMEMASNLQTIYEKLEFSILTPIRSDKFELALRAFLTEIIAQQYTNVAGLHDLERAEDGAREIDDQYDNIVMWAKDIYLTLEFWRSRANPFLSRSLVTFDHAAEVVHEVLHRFGGIMKWECASLKEDMMAMELADTGRVLLSDFYASDKMKLRESKAYLSNLGTLEEEGQRPRVVMVNYINSPSRSMPFSSYYGVRCPDLCEPVMWSLERSIAVPSAPPAQVVDVISRISSDTIDAPRNLSASLLNRLEEIAVHHGGRVPLHGRLFMQWMHHAFPRECPFPHTAGTVKPVSQDEWLLMNEDVDDAMASDAEIVEWVQSSKARQHGSDNVVLPWIVAEELVAADKQKVKVQTGGSLFLRTVMGCIALVSAMIPLLRSSAGLLTHSPCEKNVLV